jgi:5-hydroxyisourate hydrolase
MGRLSTHVLDTANGIPAQGIAIDLHKIHDDGSRSLIKSVITNADGRTDTPLLDDNSCKLGIYELTFKIGVYFRSKGNIPATPAFFDHVPVRFAITDEHARYHVPLVCSPWSYSTYRGS